MLVVPKRSGKFVRISMMKVKLENHLNKKLFFLTYLTHLIININLIFFTVFNTTNNLLLLKF
jgi:hypothetical protein